MPPKKSGIFTHQPSKDSRISFASRASRESSISMARSSSRNSRRKFGFERDASQRERDSLTYMEMKTKADLRKTKTFRKIEHDIKQKKKQKDAEMAKSGGKREVAEMYTDKDRAIAVAIGAEDLKGHVMKLRGQMVRSNRAEVETLGVNILLEQAAFELRYGEPRKCLAYLEKGLDLKPESIECLTLRSKCLLEMNMNKEALADADEVLNSSNDAKNQKVLIVKGDALYNLGDFEHALLNYHRANKYSTTKEKDDLRQRIIRSECAITNSVGANASRYFKNLDKLLNDIPRSMIELPWSHIKKVVHAGIPSKLKNSKSKDKMFLNELAQDKKYLEEILHQLTSLKHTKTILQENIFKEATEGLNFLIERREFWAQQNPEHPDDILREPFVHSSWKDLIKTVQKHNETSKLFEDVNLFEIIQ